MDYLWAFDCEWAPDLTAGRRLYHLPAEIADDEVLRVMWENAPDFDRETNPQPFLKTVLCRVVSVALVVRKTDPTRPASPAELSLVTLPALDGHAPEDPVYGEANILETLLANWFPRCTPTFVGFNSRNADLHILAQRAMVNGIRAPEFAARVAAKPWNSPDIDLMEVVGSRGGRTYNCSLNEIANLFGVPGKMETTGDDVAGLFYGGHLRRVVEYNTFDALTTYLVWLRTELFAGHFTPVTYEGEVALLRDLIIREAQKPYGSYLTRYLETWEEMGSLG